MQLQTTFLLPKRQQLQSIHGHKTLAPIHGAGCTKNPDILFLFMNPTGKNVSADPQWTGIRAARLGTKNVRKIFFALKIISEKTFKEIQSKKANERTPKFAQHVYQEIADHKAYITNLAKCTQIDARPLKDKVFKEYLEHTLQEIKEINPKHIIAFGNQVSSVLLGRPIKVSDYKNDEHETLTIESTERRNENLKISENFHDVELIPTTLDAGTSNKVQKFKISKAVVCRKYKVYPTFYPVGQGTRNMPQAIERIKGII